MRLLCTYIYIVYIYTYNPHTYTYTYFHHEISGFEALHPTVLFMSLREICIKFAHELIQDAISSAFQKESYWWFPEIRVPLVIIHFERWDFPLSTLQLLGDPHDYGNPHIILNHVIFIHQQPSLNLHNHSPMTMETPIYIIIPLWNTVHIPLNPYWLFLMMINDGYLMEIPHVFPLLTIIYHITTMC